MSLIHAQLRQMSAPESQSVASKEMDAEQCPFVRLPTELLDLIFSHLYDPKAPPLSQTNFRNEPSRNLTSLKEKPVKNLSRVCRRFRQHLLPLLFRHVVLELDRQVVWLRMCSSLRTCAVAENKISFDPRLSDLITEVDGLMERMRSSRGAVFDANVPLGFRAVTSREWRNNFGHFLHWWPGIQGAGEELIAFVKRNGLQSNVKSLVVYGHEKIPDGRSNLEATMMATEVRKLWKTIFCAIESLETVTVAAPPSAMAMLSGGEQGLWDDWLFDMDYHYLRLSRPDPFKSVTSREASPPRPATTSYLYNLLPWTTLSYNEGSFLKGYAHYEYQWMKPPLILPSLLKYMSRSSVRTLCSVEYLAIFPYYSHVWDILELLADMPSLQHLHLKFADPDILGDPARAGRADPSDVYSEWGCCYSHFPRTLLVRLRDGLDLFLQDAQHKALREQLEESLGKALVQFSEFRVTDDGELEVKP